mmetsp:Transcript_36/g.130  ORF Transcript_36/g.130 Transcript_36/m.130 type:complete len:97 (-) Transcript_36:619-909(-)
MLRTTRRKMSTLGKLEPLISRSSTFPRRLRRKAWMRFDHRVCAQRRRNAELSQRVFFSPLSIPRHQLNIENYKNEPLYGYVDIDIKEATMKGDKER